MSRTLRWRAIGKREPILIEREPELGSVGSKRAPVEPAVCEPNGNHWRAALANDSPALNRTLVPHAG
jgi:hypothetical protein